MKLVDDTGHEWRLGRSPLPWTPRVNTQQKLERHSFSGINDLPGLVIAVGIPVLLLAPALAELLFEAALIPFVLLLRILRLARTPVVVRRVPAVGWKDGREVPETALDLGHWRILVSGHARAGRLRDALVPHLEERGRNADVPGFATAWLSGERWN